MHSNGPDNQKEESSLPLGLCIVITIPRPPLQLSQLCLKHCAVVVVHGGRDFLRIATGQERWKMKRGGCGWTTGAQVSDKMWSNANDDEFVLN